jgi:glutamyl-tRNA synthetase
MTNPIRVRFAPSPTGYLHVGGARSALFNYLFAKHHQGTFILRIEDTDRTRFVEGALTEIYESLKWLGISWDEGPDVEGECGPYTQSERVELYRSHAEQLLKSGSAYRCFCTAERLAEMRKEQEKRKIKVGYDRHCCFLTKEEVQQRLGSDDPFVIRFKIPEARTIRFIDAIRGAIEYKSDVLDDFVLLKTDGFPTYHLANVVDDHLMAISHVLRGDEWIASTPRHILLYEAFGWNVPQFAHLPIILAEGGGKLSKRKGAASVMDYKKAGYLPEALMNFLALLGWAPGGDREKMSFEELIHLFSLEQVSPKASVFDEKKLEWMNGIYLAEQSVTRLVSEVVPLLQEEGIIPIGEVDIDYLSQVIELLRTRSKKLTDLVEAARYFYCDPDSYEEKGIRKYFSEDAADRLDALRRSIGECNEFIAEKLEALFRTAAESMGVGFGKLIHPVRLAVSGVTFGPGLFELLAVLGKDRVLARIEKAIHFIKQNK